MRRAGYAGGGFHGSFPPRTASRGPSTIVDQLPDPVPRPEDQPPGAVRRARETGTDRLARGPLAAGDLEEVQGQTGLPRGDRHGEVLGAPHLRQPARRCEDHRPHADGHVRRRGHRLAHRLRAPARLHHRSRACTRPAPAVRGPVVAGLLRAPSPQDRPEHRRRDQRPPRSSAHRSPGLPLVPEHPRPGTGRQQATPRARLRTAGLRDLTPGVADHWDAAVSGLRRCPSCPGPRGRGCGSGRRSSRGSPRKR